MLQFANHQVAHFERPKVPGVSTNLLKKCKPLMMGIARVMDALNSDEAEKSATNPAM